jgi:redox-regulated HSP33 family molecular chaperone
MVENGLITVTCEFCNSTYAFEPDKLTSELPGNEVPKEPLN